MKLIDLVHVFNMNHQLIKNGRRSSSSLGKVHRRPVSLYDKGSGTKKYVRICHLSDMLVVSHHIS